MNASLAYGSYEGVPLCEWSRDGPQLRTLAFSSPALLDHAAVQKHFTHLSLVDKQVCRSVIYPVLLLTGVNN